MSYKNIENIIVNTSCYLFTENGYDNVSINDICSACGITKPTFYYHFKSKESILFKYMRNIMDNILASPDRLMLLKSGAHNTVSIFKVLYKDFTAIGRELLRHILAVIIDKAQDILYITPDLEKLIIANIKKGQGDNSIANTTSGEVLYMECRIIFYGYILLWCFNEGTDNDIPYMEMSFYRLFAETKQQ